MGGEGRASGGHQDRVRLMSKGYRTRDPKKASSRYILERRKNRTDKLLIL